MYYVCHEHQVAYPKPRQVNGHRAKIRNESGTDCNVGELEEVPQGYSLKAAPPTRNGTAQEHTAPAPMASAQIHNVLSVRMLINPDMSIAGVEIKASRGA